jgi:superoxide dismutase, Fe-Mn family
MAHELPPLPYPKDALVPHMSAETVELHHGAHQRGYIEKLNTLIKGTSLENRKLEDIILATAKGATKASIFNNAAQAWNHEFFWRSMRPNGGGEPTGDVMEQIERAYGKFHAFRDAFLAAAQNQFGSGWVWMALDHGKLKIMATANADNPLVHNAAPLACCDLWEHAYYIDYRNRRADFVTVFIDILIDWSFVLHNLARQTAHRAA